LFNVKSAFGTDFVLEIKSLLCYGGDGVTAGGQVLAFLRLVFDLLSPVYEAKYRSIAWHILDEYGISCCHPVTTMAQQ
jgi:hypothetical protein